MSVLRGKDVAKHVEGIQKEQIQSNGVDLTVDKMYKFLGTGKILRNNVELPEYVEVTPDEKGLYHLDKGIYLFQVREKVSVPLDSVGICLPRSSLIRMGVDIGAALWDSGYVGHSRILLKVDNPIIIERGSRIAQFILIRSYRKVGLGYKGRYQNE